MSLINTKTGYADLTDVLAADANINILIGGRNCGKSYAVSDHYIADLAFEGKKFCYVRRSAEEVKPQYVDSYLRGDPSKLVKKYFKGSFDGLYCKGDSIYLGNTLADPKTGKPRKILGDLAGYTISLYAEMTGKTKSRSFPGVGNIILEEFITNTIYLRNEPDVFQNLLSTVARSTRPKVWLVGNTLSRTTPYYEYWGLRDIRKMNSGEIRTYTYTKKNQDPIKLAVAYFGEPEGVETLAFGKSAEAIDGAGYLQRPCVILEKPKYKYETMYTIYFDALGKVFVGEFLFDKETGDPLWYVYSTDCSVPAGGRIITSSISQSILSTVGLIPLNDREKLAFQWLTLGKIFFDNKDTGSEFYDYANAAGFGLSSNPEYVE